MNEKWKKTGMETGSVANEEEKRKNVVSHTHIFIDKQYTNNCKKDPTLIFALDHR